MVKALKYLLKEGIQVYQMFISYLPGTAGVVLRYRYWRKRLRYLGKNVKIDVGVYFQNPEHISIGDNSWIDRGVIILAGPDKSKRERRYIPNPDYQLEKGEVYIGKYVHISPYVTISGIGGVYISDECGIAAGSKIYSFSQHYRSDKAPGRQDIIFGPQVSHEQQFVIEGPIYLGKNVGVAMDSIILPGVSIGDNSFVALKSVVKDSFGENSIVAGNPAKKVKDRFLDVGYRHNE